MLQYTHYDLHLKNRIEYDLLSQNEDISAFQQHYNIK